VSRRHLPRFQALAYGKRQCRPHRRGDHPQSARASPSAGEDG
jgi:hypothetical protein